MLPAVFNKPSNYSSDALHWNVCPCASTLTLLYCACFARARYSLPGEWAVLNGFFIYFIANPRRARYNTHNELAFKGINFGMHCYWRYWVSRKLAPNNRPKKNEKKSKYCAGQRPYVVFWTIRFNVFHCLITYFLFLLLLWVFSLFELLELHFHS